MILAGAIAAVQVLADGNSPADVDPTTGHGPEWGKAAPIGLLIVVLLCVAVYFLVKSMNRNLRKVPESFDPAAKVAVGAVPATGTADASTATSSTVSGGNTAADTPPAVPPATAGPASDGRPAE